MNIFRRFHFNRTNHWSQSESNAWHTELSSKHKIHWRARAQSNLISNVFVFALENFQFFVELFVLRLLFSDARLECSDYFAIFFFESGLNSGNLRINKFGQRIIHLRCHIARGASSGIRVLFRLVVVVHLLWRKRQQKNENDHDQND